ncbi:hypothetical protein Dsin_015540 [Dipteronia sinensis]|uniref:MULE transposase domain-containing protein n=1 Tax=Dipteronia sinensis TaxID=43782 RepID=A0AAE0ABI2_9ROSI|nr:hypothetical protein Dsin_015540 [Dipteronia sinensis]
MRPVITVDDTHLKGSYKGTMFMDASMDGNEQIYPLAFGFGDSENNESWEWFLEILRGAIGYVKDLVFIFNQHQSIQAGVEKIFPYAAHTFCIWHLSENVKKTFHKKDLGGHVPTLCQSIHSTLI